MQRSDLDDISRRPAAYWHVDGIPELGAGVLWIFWGIALLLGRRLPADWRANAYWAVVPVLLAASGAASIWAVKRVKARLTFPRTGHVAWHEPTAAMRMGAAAIGAATASLIVATVVKGSGSGAAIAPPIVAGVLSLAFVVAAMRWRFADYLLLAAVAAVLGFVLRGGENGWAGVNWLLLALGAASALVGAVRLLLFMRAHPKPSMESA